MIVSDYKENGLWVKARGDAGKPYFIRTLASKIWNGMKCRCRVGGFHQKKEPTYIGCKMSESFQDFQYFADWCQIQAGYGKDEWALDKDILLKGNKFYSEDTCIFVPREVNTCFTKNNARRGDLPIGVSFNAQTGRYMARCHTNAGESNYLGLHTAPEEAFAAYKTTKESYIKQLAEKYKEQIDPRAYQALMNYQVEITD